MSDAEIDAIWEACSRSNKFIAPEKVMQLILNLKALRLEVRKKRLKLVRGFKLTNVRRNPNGTLGVIDPTKTSEIYFPPGTYEL